MTEGEILEKQRQLKVELDELVKEKKKHDDRSKELKEAIDEHWDDIGALIDASRGPKPPLEGTPMASIEPGCLDENPHEWQRIRNLPDILEQCDRCEAERTAAGKPDEPGVMEGTWTYTFPKAAEEPTPA